jgi:hypothetical protein
LLKETPKGRGHNKYMYCCVDAAVWIVALKAAACLKTRFWALFEAE